jgi:hypothetical protein
VESKLNKFKKFNSQTNLILNEKIKKKLTILLKARQEKD